MSEIRAGYVWTHGAPISIDIDEAVEELERIEAEHQAMPLDVVMEHGRRRGNPLYAHFEHDPARAHDAWNLKQAGDLVRAIRYRLVNTVTEEERVGPRVYRPLRAINGDTSRPGVYMRCTQATTDAPDPRAHIPTRIAVGQVTTDTPPPAPVTMMPVRVIEDTPRPHPAVIPPPPSLPARPDTGLIALPPARERWRKHLLNLVANIGDDPYFADVIRAIHALP